MTIRLKARRAISTVVTSVILVAAVAMMGSFLVSWSQTSFASHRLEIGDVANDRVNSVRENLMIENVWFYTNQTGEFIDVTVRNAGDTAVNVTSVHIGSDQFSIAENVLPGDYSVIDIMQDYTTGQSYTIQVQTERNNVLRQVWVA